MVAELQWQSRRYSVPAPRLQCQLRRSVHLEFRLSTRCTLLAVNFRRYKLTTWTQRFIRNSVLSVLAPDTEHGAPQRPSRLSYTCFTLVHIAKLAFFERYNSLSRCHNVTHPVTLEPSNGHTEHLSKSIQLIWRPGTVSLTELVGATWMQRPAHSAHQLWLSEHQNRLVELKIQLYRICRLHVHINGTRPICHVACDVRHSYFHDCLWLWVTNIASLAIRQMIDLWVTASLRGSAKLASACLYSEKNPKSSWLLTRLTYSSQNFRQNLSTTF